MVDLICNCYGPGESRTQAAADAEDFIVDLMHQGDQEVKQYNNVNIVR